MPGLAQQSIPLGEELCDLGSNEEFAQSNLEMS
jgi:hypothetical protein